MTDEQRLSDQAMRFFGFDPQTGEPAQEGRTTWRPVEEMTTAELEAELLRLSDDYAMRDELETVERLKTDPAYAGWFYDQMMLGLAPGERLHTEVASNMADLEAQAMQLMLGDDDLVEVPKAEVERLLSDAASFDREVARSMAEERERAEAQRVELEGEADRLWPAVRAHLGWGWME